MPSWQPNWNKVRWDWGAADAATSALRRAADKLDQTAHDRRRVAADAQQQWRGEYREEFDQQLDRMLTRARELTYECREAATRIGNASQRAWEEKRHRERERERWWREKREEEERERRRREEAARRRRGGT